MKSTVLVFTLALGLVGQPFAQQPKQAQKPPKGVQIDQTWRLRPPGTFGWKKSALDAGVLAKRVDSATKGLKNSFHEAMLRYESATGGFGTAICDVKIQSKFVYKIQFPSFDTKTPMSGEIRADGVRYAVFAGNQWTQPALLTAKKPEFPGKIAPAWPLAFPRMIYTPFLYDADLWSRLVKELRTPANGYSVRVEERSTLGPDKKPVKMYRLWVERTPAAAKKYGKLTFEMVFDGTRYVPVTIRTQVQKATDKYPVRLQWLALWRAGMKWPPSEFQLPRQRG
jgi:hypothetical protein